MTFKFTATLAFCSLLFCGLLLHPAMASAQAGNISLQASTLSVDQNWGSISFEVTRSGGSAGQVSVSYATSDGTATQGVDYTKTSGTLSWAAGDSTTIKTITVPWLDINSYSGSKTFSITLSNATNGASITPYAATLVTVTDDEIPPSEFYNGATNTMANWKLTLPVDVYGGIGGINSAQFEAATITNTQLMGSNSCSPYLGFADPYFYGDSTGHMNFVAYSNGATTEPTNTSSHTRSELRELYTGTGMVNLNEWTNATGGTLDGHCTVQQASSTAKLVVFSQIHADGEPMVLLEYRPGYNDIAVAYYADPTVNAQQTTEILSGIALGTTVHYTVSYIGNTLTVTAKTTTATNTLTFDATKWSGVGVYFKLGVYHDSPHTGNPAGDYSRVVYDSFTLSH